MMLMVCMLYLLLLAPVTPAVWPVSKSTHVFQVLSKLVRPKVKLVAAAITHTTHGRQQYAEVGLACAVAVW